MIFVVGLLAFWAQAYQNGLVAIETLSRDVGKVQDFHRGDIRVDDVSGSVGDLVESNDKNEDKDAQDEDSKEENSDDDKNNEDDKTNDSDQDPKDTTNETNSTDQSSDNTSNTGTSTNHQLIIAFLVLIAVMFFIFVVIIIIVLKKKKNLISSTFQNSEMSYQRLDH